MSLQTRLFAFFVAIVVLPLGVAAVLGQRTIVRELEQRTFAQLVPSHRAAVAVYNERAAGFRDRVQLIISSDEFSRLLRERNFPALQGHLREELERSESRVDYMVVVDPSGNVLAEALTEPRFLPGVNPPSAAEILAGVAPSTDGRLLMVTRSVVPVSSAGSTIATVVGGYYLDNEFADELSANTGADATVFLAERAVSSTLPSARRAKRAVQVDLSGIEAGSFAKLTIGGSKVYAIPGRLSSSLEPEVASLVMSTSREPILRLTSTIRTSTAVLLFVAVVGSALLGFSLARVISRPLRDLAAGANAIATGHYDQHIDIKSHDEVGQLARAFNEMAQRLSVYITELKESREELKRALTRFGETLRSTHDLERILRVVLDTSVDTLRAERGLLMWMSPARDSLVANIARGVDVGDLELGLGEGVAGYVAAAGEPVRLPDGDIPSPSPREPSFRTMLAVPIFSQERVIAVLNLYDKAEDLTFTEADLGTLLSLTDQAGVAIENVLLHQEARRQAIMDGLTGVWNYRYFRIRYEQEIDRSARFRRPFSLVVVDIDDFKQVNDAHGHQRGDSVLIELARRVKAAIRDIDVLARYGGEEFALILPETDAEGGRRTAEKIRSIVGDAPFEGSPPLNITVSAGLSCFPEHGADGQTLLRSADAALYLAKAQGKNCVVVFGREKLPSG